MDLSRRVQVLEVAYAGIQADAVRCFDKEGILEKVTEQKKKEQMAMGKQQAERFGIQTAEEVFIRLSQMFNCAVWKIVREGSTFTAEAKACKLCAIAKKTGKASPCRIYCLNPMEGMVKGLNPANNFDVKETLWDGEKCCVEVKEA
ncbi:MAG: L-2-amino-thiazoline-4-carboxylic acid hydrolase [bacterium]|jgi:hypothetical protein